MKIGEGFVGEGANAAHINVVLGLRDGPVGTAWATALATPREGHVPFVAVAQPNMPVVPFTLFVNKAAIANDRHGELTWGAAQAGRCHDRACSVVQRCAGHTAAIGEGGGPPPVRPGVVQVQLGHGRLQLYKCFKFKSI